MNNPYEKYNVPFEKFVIGPTDTPFSLKMHLPKNGQYENRERCHHYRTLSFDDYHNKINKLTESSVYYDDIDLVACRGTHPTVEKSRTLVPNELHRVIVSPMAAVVGQKFGEEALQEGLSLCIPRFSSSKNKNTIGNQVETYLHLKNFKKNDKQRIWAAVGLNEFDRVAALVSSGCKDILVDIANGYLPSLYVFCRKIKAQHCISIMTGNIHTLSYFFGRQDCVDLFRVGIGGGSACATSTMTGFTRGQISELVDCREHFVRRYQDPVELIADGGIRTPGDCMKAFCAGAHYVMLGGYFKNASSAQNVIEGNFKYWGGASDFQQKLENKEVRRHSEGKVLEVSEPVPLKDLVRELWGGISSGISYSGYPSLSALVEDAPCLGLMHLKHRR